jgi:histidine ammonia-lyase
MMEFETPDPTDPTPPEIVELGAGTLTVSEVAAVAYRQASVELSPVGRERASVAHLALRQIAERRAVYGRSTGVGANKDRAVGSAAAPSHGVQLLRSHAAGAGPDVDPAVSRAMMAVRVNQLGAGGSGVNPTILDAMTRAINQGVVPPIKRYGGIGTGDLPALATTALCLMGEKPWLGGSTERCEFTTDDALAFMSSSAATLGESALAGHLLRRRLNAGLKVAALSFVAMGGSAEAYAVQVQEARPYPGQIAAAAELRQLLHANTAGTRHIQDRYGLRTLPQAQGLALDATGRLDGVLAVEMNAAGENPLVSAAAGEVYHNGNFYAGYVTAALDSLRSAVYSSAAMSAARLSALMEPELTGLRPFLASGPETSSGALILEYVGQSALAELRHLAMPDSLGGAVLSRGAEEHASFAAQAAWHTTASLPAYETVLACELVAAVRALRQQSFQPGSGALGAFYATAETVLDADMADRDLEADIGLARSAVRTAY